MDVPLIDVPSHSPSKKAILSVTVCIFLILTFTSFNIPFAFLPLYNKDRNIPPFVTGAILGANSLCLIPISLFLAPFLLDRSPTKVLLAGSAAGFGVVMILTSLLDYITDSIGFSILALFSRFISGVFGGVLEVTAFSGLINIFPGHVGTATAVGEAVLNGALAFGPYFGGILYATGGFKLAHFVPGLMLLCSFVPGLCVPNINKNNNDNNNRPAEGDDNKKWTSLLDPWIVFPIWHLASAQILLGYHMPLLAVYVESAFRADVVWAGSALAVSTAGVCLSSPLLGILIDRFGPCPMLMASSVCLPVVYMCLGPLPLLSFITPCRLQLIISLAFLGCAVPMATIAALPAMFEVYQLKNGVLLSPWVVNSLVSAYCSAFPFGFFIGSTVSGFIAPYVPFRWSTGTIGLLYILQSVACCIYCIRVLRMKSDRNEEEEEPILQNRDESTTSCKHYNFEA